MDDQNLTLRHLGPKDLPSVEESAAILALSKKHSATLGFLRDEAFSDRIANGSLITASRAGMLIGYCMYDTPRSGHIKLVQVCVDERGKRLGQRLIEAAVDARPHATGVYAWCRRDYGLERFWRSAGLSPRGERPGRAVAGSVLTRWWRPLGELDLFEEAALQSQHPLVMYDTNVVSDLYLPDHITRPNRRASQALLADWVQAETVAVVSAEVDVEIDQVHESDRREQLRAGSAGITRVRLSARTDPALHRQMVKSLPPAKLSADPSLEQDLRHVADAVSNGVSYFVTNDANLLQAAQAILQPAWGLKVLRPHQLIADLRDEAERPRFRSRLIETADLEWRSAPIAEESLLSNAFVTQELAERGKEFIRRLRETIAHNAAGTHVLGPPNGDPWALAAVERAGDALIVSLLRVRRGAAAITVALQLARYLRQQAQDAGVARVAVTDPELAPLVRNALELDGFAETSGHLVAELRDEVVAASTLALDGDFDDVVARVRDAERRYWPLTIVEAPVRTFVAPIQPRFMEGLLQIDRGGLLPAGARALGLSREHVYYSNAKSQLPPVGARILWYTTKDFTGTIRKVLAHSRSMGHERLEADAAFDRNAQIGVFQRSHVREAAGKDGRVTVVRFEDTVVLTDPVDRTDFEGILRDHSIKPPVLSFREVPSGLFDDVIRRQARSVA